MRLKKIDTLISVSHLFILHTPSIVMVQTRTMKKPSLTMATHKQNIKYKVRKGKARGDEDGRKT
jgi:hypothetical protein